MTNVIFQVIFSALLFNIKNCVLYGMGNKYFIQNKC